jgi:hypothetical protein
VHAVFATAQEALLVELGGTTLADIIERGVEGPVSGDPPPMAAA